MFSQYDDGQQGLVLAVVGGVVALVIALVSGVIGFQRHQPVISVIAAPLAFAAAPMSQPLIPSPATVALSAADVAQAASDLASVKVEQGVVKFYFASGKADLAAGAGEALVDVVKGAKSGRKLLISGFHDTTGNAGRNAALARQRALTVRDALRAAGVAAGQIELQKPVPLADSGSDAEARRVEISIQ
ncbi:MAG: OmpA family protein [Polaromonas sp.]|uniref:OmpA family protein n=1 Tax=Polaromonas sp. TaxID=1869339 RepID=UPI001827A1A7|nr:OmpA family protein [Polaromonas sp.]NMM11067.1 OmpA family protein [Polaromonas sp.]